MGEAALRTGGLPLLDKDRSWPRCLVHDLPMLFRTQVPLAVTSLVAWDDDRILQVFECHAREQKTGCLEGHALVVGGDLAATEPPESDAFDVIVQSVGGTPEAVLKLSAALAACDPIPPDQSVQTPFTVIQSCPGYVAREAARALGQVGGRASLAPSAPTLLGSCHGGRLMPFEDGEVGSFRTTLPPLEGIIEAARTGTMRGLIAGATPGYRDHSFLCECGRVTRTALRLFADSRRRQETICLGPATVQVCLKCDRAWLHRNASH